MAMDVPSALVALSHLVVTRTPWCHCRHLRFADQVQRCRKVRWCVWSHIVSGSWDIILTEDTGLCSSVLITLPEAKAFSLEMRRLEGQKEKGPVQGHAASRNRVEYSLVLSPMLSWPLSNPRHIPFPDIWAGTEGWGRKPYLYSGSKASAKSGPPPQVVL